MSDKSKIQWTDASWNPVIGCRKVSAGCAHCYAIRQAARIEKMQPNGPYVGLTVRRGNGALDWSGAVKCLPERLTEPLRWRKPRRIFVDSMSDLFHEDVPEEFIARVFATMWVAHRHRFIILTKRPERMRDLLSSDDFDGDVGTALGNMLDGSWIHDRANQQYRKRIERGIALAYGVEDEDDEGDDRPVVAEPFLPLGNVLLGVSAENQETADERIPILLETPAVLRGVSLEPLLGAVTLADHWLRPTPALPAPLDWVIVGGESGKDARPFSLRWAETLVEECREAGVPAFVKQLGTHAFDPPAGVPRLLRISMLKSGAVTHAVRDDGGWERGELLEAYARVKTKDRAGGDMNEWPEDLRVREFPPGF